MAHLKRETSILHAALRKIIIISHSVLFMIGNVSDQTYRQSHTFYTW